MVIGDPVKAMTSAIYSAIQKDLPDVNEIRRTGNTVPRRPRLEELEVYQFPQDWGSTALGFEGVGGASMSRADTTVVSAYTAAAVYFAGRLAYVLDSPNIQFWRDVRKMEVLPVEDRRKYAKKTTIGTQNGPGH